VVFHFGLVSATSLRVGITAGHLEVLELSDWEFQDFIFRMGRAEWLLAKQLLSRFRWRVEQPLTLN
jgi:hypothetical protein